MRRNLFTVFFALTWLLVSAQDQFLVYSYKGNVTVVSNKKESKAKNGSMLAASAKVIVPANGAVTFICKEGGMFSITEPGTYSLDDYTKSCNKGNNHVFVNFTKYMWAHATKARADQGRGRRMYFDYVSAIVRGHDDIWVDLIFDTVNYSGGKGDFTIYWRCYQDIKTFEFTLYDYGDMGKPFTRIAVNKLNIPIKDLVSNIKQGKSYYWGVAIPGEEDEELHVLNYVSKASYDSIHTIIKNLRPVFEAPAEEAYRMAFMLENAHYFDEAYEYYLMACELDPTNVFYKLTLAVFKKDYDIK